MINFQLLRCLTLIPSAKEAKMPRVLRQKQLLHNYAFVVAVFLPPIYLIFISPRLMGPPVPHTSPTADTQDRPAQVEAMLKKPQEDPSLISFVRENIIVPYVLRTPYNLSEPTKIRQSRDNLETRIYLALKNMTAGFFIECGNRDGETDSNTLYMERFLGWQGLLVEGNPQNFKSMFYKHRKAWLAPTCLSFNPYPSTFSYYKQREFKTGKFDRYEDDEEVQKTTVLCTPLTTLALALDRTHVDYLSLNIKGREIDALKTINFNKINISAISVAHPHLDKAGQGHIKWYLESQGYQLVEPTEPTPNDQTSVFVKREMLND